jgi:hypothetical protein
MFLTITSSARLAASLDWTTLIPAAGVGTILGSVVSSLIAPHFQYQRERALRRDDDARRLRDRRAERLRSRLGTIVADSRMSFEHAATLLAIPAPDVPERLRAMADRRADSIARAAAEIGAMQLDLESVVMTEAVGELLGGVLRLYAMWFAEATGHASRGEPLPPFVTTAELESQAEALRSLVIKIEAEARRMLAQLEQPM